MFYSLRDLFSFWCRVNMAAALTDRDFLNLGEVGHVDFPLPRESHTVFSVRSLSTVKQNKLFWHFLLSDLHHFYPVFRYVNSDFCIQNFKTRLIETVKYQIYVSRS